MKQKSKQPHLRVYRQIPMLQADPAEGLSPQEIKLRQSNGLSNIMPPSNTKSEGQIIKENVLTFFNLIFLVLALCLCLVGSFKNLMFLLVAVANTVVGSFQEIRAKRAVDKLTLVAAGTAKAIRSGQRVSVRTDQLVRDDIVEFAAGDQICADAVVRDGQLQVNDSLLTGEADAILKNPGDTLKSGSFVISGRARVQLTHVGSESYAAKLAAEARRNVRSTKSEMMLSLTKLITVVGIALIPLGIILFLRHFLSVFQGLPLRDSVESTVSALIGMIPEGLYLLTSVAIAASCLKLSRKRVLVQDMNCIETLAHVDVLCVDKTGTITEPTMEVTDVYPLNSERFSYDDIERILAAFYHGEEPDNETARAMGQQFAGETTWRAVKRMAFSSSTKWSGADFGENGRYVVGAPVLFTLTGWDTAEQGTTYTLTAEGYKIGENGVQLGLPSDSSTVNTQAAIAAALTIVNTAVTAPNKNTNTVGFTTITISAVNAPSRELTVAIFGLEEAERVTVTEPVIEGISVPVARKYPAKVVREGRQFTGTVAWSPSAVAFNYATVYTATITLKAKVGYTFDGVAENFFTAAGAASVSNAAFGTQSAAVLTSLAPHDSKARLLDMSKRRDSWRSHVHRTRFRSACNSVDL